MTTGLARDRAKAWPVSQRVTAGDWTRHYLAPSQTQRPTADPIRTSFPSLLCQGALAEPSSLDHL